MGSSAIVKVPEQVGAAKSAGNRVPRKVPRKSFLLQENPSEQPDRHGARLGTRFPGRGSQARFLSNVPRNRFPSKVSKRFPGTGSRARVPSKRFPSKISRYRFFQAKQGSQNRFSNKCFQEEVSRKRCTSKVPSKLVPKQCFQEEVPKQGSQPQVPSHRFPGTGAHTRFPRTDSQVRFPECFQEKVPKQSSQQQSLKQGC